MKSGKRELGKEKISDLGGTKEKEKTIRRRAEPEDERRRRIDEKDREEIGIGGGVITDCTP